VAALCTRRKLSLLPNHSAASYFIDGPYNYNIVIVERGSIIDQFSFFRLSTLFAQYLYDGVNQIDFNATILRRGCLCGDYYRHKRANFCLVVRQFVVCFHSPGGATRELPMKAVYYVYSDRPSTRVFDGIGTVAIVRLLAFHLDIMLLFAICVSSTVLSFT